MRPSTSRCLAVSLGLAALGLGACADDGHDDGTSYNCAAETRDEEFVVGLSKAGMGSKLEFKLVSADPAPPLRGDNIWILQLTTMAQPAAPLTGATMGVTPFMPDHQHGSGKTVKITPMTEAGQYKLEPVNLWMPGLWETTIEVDGASGDKAVFRFCLSN